MHSTHCDVSWPRLVMPLIALLSSLPLSADDAAPARGVANETVTPFKADVSEEVLVDLRRRLAQARWPDELAGTKESYGIPLAVVRNLAGYWESGYDWREHEARLNRFDQFTTEIDGQRIHFIHQRSSRSDAMPLVLLHGWPGSIVEFLDMVEPLTTPAEPGHPAFHVVVPSLPGTGFSGPTRTPGWNTQRIARAFAELLGRLGYSRYAVHGGDWGSFIGQFMASEDASHVIGLHSTFLPVPPPDPEALAKLTELERARLNALERDEFAFFELQEKRPLTVGYALADSPTGWLAWTADLFQTSTDHDGDFLSAVDRDEFLTNITLYWVTDTIASSLRLYREVRLSGGNPAPKVRLSVPVAHAVFPKEVIVSPYPWIDAAYDVVQRTEMPKGGHHPGFEQPELLVADIRKFFGRPELRR